MRKEIPLKVMGMCEAMGCQRGRQIWSQSAHTHINCRLLFWQPLRVTVTNTDGVWHTARDPLVLSVLGGWMGSKKHHGRKRTLSLQT